MSEPSDAAPVEMLRVQLAGDEMHFTIAADIFEEPGAWGHILADIARQIAQTLHEEEGRDAAATLRAIGDTFVSEIDKDFPGASE
jgi:hypothetical protein